MSSPDTTLRETFRRNSARHDLPDDRLFWQWVRQAVRPHC